MKKAAIIEFNGYHDECIYSQVRFLKDSNYDVTLILSQQIFDRASEYSHLAENIIIYDDKTEKNFLRRITRIYNLYRHLRKSKIDTIVFNTASSRLEVILLGHLLKRKSKLFGILHNLKKVNHSLSQKLINKAIKKFFVLNDFLEDSVALKDESIHLKSFYPIFFPYNNKTPLNKPENETWVCIPGKLDFDRRDYSLVAEALQKIESKENLKIIVLGNTNLQDSRNIEFLDNLKVKELSQNFVTFDTFLTNPLFHQYIEQSDYILIPLKTVGNNYAMYKIMGCYNLAFAYQKNLIAPKGLGHIPDIHSHSYFYDGAQGLSKILERVTAEKLEPKKYASEKWTYENQKSRYINFLEKGL